LKSSWASSHTSGLKPGFSASAFFMSTSIASSTCAYFPCITSSCCCVHKPTRNAFSRKRRSAVSWRNLRRYSARAVNMRYGSFVPSVTKSSMSTPMYASSLPRMSGSYAGITLNFSKPAFFCAVMSASESFFVSRALMSAKVRNSSALKFGFGWKRCGSALARLLSGVSAEVAAAFGTEPSISGEDEHNGPHSLMCSRA